MATRYPRFAPAPARLVSTLALALLVVSAAQAGDPEDDQAAARISAQLPLALELLPADLRARDPDAGALLRRAGFGSDEVVGKVRRFQAIFRRKVIDALKPSPGSSVGEMDLEGSQDGAFDRARRRAAARLAAYLADQAPAERVQEDREDDAVGDGEDEAAEGAAEGATEGAEASVQASGIGGGFLGQS